MTGPGGRRGRIAAAALLVLLLVAAFPGLFTGKVFYLRDVSQNHDPARRVVTARLLEGSLPLWDPYHGGGTPLLANPNQLVLHPITLLFVALPHDLAFTLSIVLQFGLLALGGYLLARRLPVSPPAALLAAAILGFSGPAASLASMQNVLSAFAWLPLALWGWLGLVRGGGAGPLAAAVLPLAIILATGEPATLLGFVAFALVLAATERPGAEGEDAVPRPRLARALGGVAGMALLVAAAAIVPAMALLPLTPRGAGLPEAEVFRWPLLAGRLPELLLPGLFGDPTRLPPRGWWGAWLFEGGYPFLFCVFFGAIPILCAAAALGPGPSRRRAIGCAAVGAAVLALALAPGFPAAAALIRAIPGARLLRYPERLLLVVTLAAALLAALGWERLRQRLGASRIRCAALAIGAALALLAALLVIRPASLDPVLAGLMKLPAAYAGGEGMAVVRRGALHSIAWAAFDAALFAAAIAALRRGGARGAWAGWGLPAAAAISMLLAAAPARSMTPRDRLEAASPFRDVVDRGAGAPRLHHGSRPPGLAVRGETDEQVWGFRFDRFTYALQSGAPDEVPTVFDAATDRMDLEGSAALAARLPSLSPAEQVRILRVAGAGSVLSYAPLEDPGIVPGPLLAGLSRPEARLYRLADPLPRIRFVPRQRPPRDPHDTVASLLDPGFDPDGEVLIDAAPATPDGDQPVHAAVRSLPPAPAEPVPIDVLQDDPERVTISLVAPSAGHLVVSDSDAPGWVAFVDGVRAPIRRANMLFRAVPVPAGRHTIEMRYRPRSVVVGAVTSLCGVVVLAVACVRRRRT